MKIRSTVLGLILAVLLIVGSVSCSSAEPAVSDNPEVQTESDEHEEAAETPEPTPEPTPEQTPEPTPEPTPTPEPPLAIEETVLCDNDEIKIVATGIRADGHGISLACSIENKTDKDFDEQPSDVLVNGYQCFAMGGIQTVPTGQSINVDLLLFMEELEPMMITKDTIEEIKVRFEYGEHDRYWEWKEADMNPVRTNKTAGEPLDISAGTVLYDDNSILMVFLGRNEEKNALELYIENNTDKRFYFTADSKKMKIDGYGTSDWASSVLANAKAVHSVSYYDDGGSLIPIDWEIKEVTFAYELEIEKKTYKTEPTTFTFE